VEALLDLQLLTPVDWRVLKRARLEALLDSPDAFTSSYAEESAWGESEWRRALNTAVWIVARETGRAIGLARSIVEPRRPCARHLESIWVAPAHRRRGVLSEMVHTFAEMYRRSGVTELLLWVLENNQRAQLAYQALGFEPTGERQFMPDFGQFERRMRLTIHTPARLSTPTNAVS
jgi:ribosomal protein S18 acetylase RimI-like enzyme